MKFFANRNIWKKIVIVLSLIFSMSFVKPAPVNASLETAGGELMEPICDLLVWLGDGFLGVTHSLLIHQETTIIRVDLNNTLQKILRKVLTVGAFLIVLAAAAAITVGGVVAIGAIASAIVGTTVTIGAGTIATIVFNVIPVAIQGGIYFGAKVWTSDMFDNEIDLPLYSISPETIFSNSIPLFDVNFFNPNSKPYKYEWIHKQGTGEKFDDVKRATGKFIELTEEEKKLVEDYNILQNGEPATEEVKGYLLLDKDDTTVLIAKKAILEGKTYVQYTRQTQEADGVYYRTYSYRLNDGTSSSDASSDETSTSGENKSYALSYELANTVKFWFGIIKTMAIVGMMSVLVYIGIRILLASTSEQQAKQKKLFGDWLVGMVLLFTMQYIMVFTNIAVDHLTEIFRSINPMGQVAFIPDDDGIVEKKLVDEYNIQVSNDPEKVVDDNNMIVYKTDKDIGAKLTGQEGQYIEWHTDLMGHLRIALQANKNSKSEDSGVKHIGYTIMYLVMIVYTAIFLFTYIKRVIYMAFLTVIAPLVALTYPIDKANDGSAQGFNYWFKEYVFNLLIQPVHLLTYTILVSTAIKFATTNWIYSLIVLGFISQAEKIVRQMFNFSKASTPGVFAGPAGAALAMSGMRWLMGRGPMGGPRGGKSSGGSGSNSEEDSGVTSTGDNKVKVQSDDLDKFLGQGNSNSNPVASGQGDSATSILNVGNNGTGNDGNSVDGSVVPFSNDNSSLDQAGDYWDNYYGTNEFTDGDEGFNQTGDFWNDFYDTDEFTDGNDEVGQIRDNGNDFYDTGELTDGDIRLDQTVDNGNDLYNTDEFTDGNDGLRQIEDMWNNFYDTDEFTGDNGTRRLSGGNIRSGNIRSNSRVSGANSNRGSSGSNNSNSISSSNNYSQARTNNSSSRRRLPIANDISQREEAQRRQREQSQNGSPQTRQREQSQIDSPQRAQPQTKPSTDKKSKEEIRRERVQDHPIRGRAMNFVGKIKDGTGAVASSYADDIKQSVKKSFKERRAGKAVARTISGVAGAALFGTAGVAVSIASGNPQTVATGAVAGIAGGYKAGKGLGNAIDNTIKPDEAAEKFQKGYMGEKEYRNMKIAENQREKALDPKRIKRIMDKKGMSKKDAEKYALQDDHNLYMENKIDDVDDWMALDSLKEEKMLNPDGTSSGKPIGKKMAVELYKEYKRSGMESKEHDKTIDKIMSDLGLKDDDKGRATAELWYQNMKILDDIING